MRLARLIVRPALPQIVENLDGVGCLSETELRPGLSGHVNRLVAQRAREDHLEVTLRLLELFEREAFLGQRLAVRDRVGDLHRVADNSR